VTGRSQAQSIAQSRRQGCICTHRMQAVPHARPNRTRRYAFDTVKVRLQTGKYSGMIHCFKHIVQTEGVRGLYQGLTPPLIGGAAETGVNYLVGLSAGGGCVALLLLLSRDEGQKQAACLPAFQSAAVLPGPPHKHPHRSCSASNPTPPTPNTQPPTGVLPPAAAALRGGALVGPASLPQNSPHCWRRRRRRALVHPGPHGAAEVPAADDRPPPRGAGRVHAAGAGGGGGVGADPGAGGDAAERGEGCVWLWGW